jgi:hypothetical protein
VDAALHEEPLSQPDRRFLFVPDPKTTEWPHQGSNAPLTRRAARLCVAARVLARHIDELGTPIAARLLEEMDQSVDVLGRALSARPWPDQEPQEDLDELLRLRCSCL